MTDYARRSKEVSRNFLSLVNGPYVEFKLNMFKLQIRFACVPLRVGVGKLTRV